MDVSDDRGQALQVGAILLFGILIVGLSLYQATVVPSQNERVEFDTYIDANTDMEQLGSGISAAAARDYSTQTAVQTGVSYPTRTLFVNPGPPGNRLRTGSNQTILISNATAVDGEEANTKTYWNGTPRPYQTKNVTFDTDYNQLQVPPIVYENGVIYRPADQNVDSSQDIVVSSGTLIQGNRITLVTIEGDLDAGGMSPTVVAEPVSAHTRTVVVTGTGSDDITLTVPSGLSNETWNDDILGNRSDVTATPNGSNVDLTLNGSQRYELRLARVELRRQSDSSTATEPEPEYVTAVAGNNESITTSQSVKLTAEVRDQYNNPVSGETVEFEIVSGGGGSNQLSDTVVTTNNQGRASVQFDPGSANTFEINASVNGGASEPLNTTTFTVSVGQGGVGGPQTGSGTDEINPSSENSVIVTSAVETSGNAKVTLENGGSQPRSMERIRVMFYFTHTTQGGPGKGRTPITSVNNITTGTDDAFVDSAEVNPSSPASIPTDYLNITSNKDISGTRDITFDFNAEVNPSGGTDLRDFFYFAVEFQNGEVATYIVTPK